MAAGAGAFDEMLQRADSAGSDDGQAHGGADGAQEIEIEAGAGAVTIHAGEQDFAGAERFDFLCPGDDVPAPWACGRHG